MRNMMYNYLFYHPGRAGGGVLQVLSGEGREGLCRGCEAPRQGLHLPAPLQGGVALRQSCPSSWIRESRPGALQNKDGIFAAAFPSFFSSLYLSLFFFLTFFSSLDSTVFLF